MILNSMHDVAAMRKAKGPAKFAVGDQVYHDRDPYRYGTVTRVTECLGTWMYDVAWSCDEIVYERHLEATGTMAGSAGHKNT